MALPLKALLFLGGASAAALGTAYVAGVFDTMSQPPAALTQSATPPPASAPEAPAAEKPAAEPVKPAEQQAAVAAPEKPAATQEAPVPVAPNFDVLRVEPDGSMVIAGRAMAGSTVEALVGSRLIGKTETTPSGDFVIVLDEPLKPGDYQVVLRSSGPGNIVVNSVETAVVSVPATPDGQVLALVEQAGAPSKLITVTPTPEPAQAGAATADAPANVTAPAAETEAAAAPAPAETPAVVAPVQAVRVEAVEIDGRKVFVAGAAPADANLRAYANEILLGDTKASPEGRFLIETERDLPVGDYIVRVDQLSPNGDKVISRATVPFKREAGEAIAAVAPAAPAETATPAAPAVQEPAPAAASPAAEAPPAVTNAPTNVQPDTAAQTPPAATAPDATQSQPAPAEAGTAATAPMTADVAAAPPESAAPAQPAEIVTAPQLEASAAGVIIRRGDTLWRISKRVYGRGTRYSTIYTANRTQIADPDRIWPGQVFRVPGKSDEGEDADMDAVEGQATKL